MPKKSHKLVLGFAHWGAAQVSIFQMIETATLAFKSGIKEVDCAPHYGNGGQENVLGVALLCQSEEVRSQTEITTKTGRRIDPNSQSENTNGFTNQSGFSQYFDYSKEGIKQSLAQSQLRMRLSNVHALYLHDLDKETHKDQFETHYNHFMKDGYEAFDDLKKQGKIKIAGIGSNNAPSCVELIKDGRFKIDRIMLAGCYNLLNFLGLMSYFPFARKKTLNCT